MVCVQQHRQQMAPSNQYLHMDIIEKWFIVGGFNMLRKNSVSQTFPLLTKF